MLCVILGIVLAKKIDEWIKNTKKSNMYVADRALNQLGFLSVLKSFLRSLKKKKKKPFHEVLVLK